MAELPLHLLCLVVLTVVVAENYGHVLPRRAIVNDGRGSPSLHGMTFRTRRNVDLDLDLDPACLEYVNCTLPENWQDFLNNLKLFNLEDASAQIYSQCEHTIDGPCSSDGCSEENLVHLSAIRRIFNWTCHRTRQVEDGVHSSCWHEPFNPLIEICSRRHLEESPDVPFSTYLPTCFSTWEEELQFCDNVDRDFVIELANELERIRN